MSIAAMNPFMGELIQTSAPGITCSWGQTAVYKQSPAAPSNTAVLALTTLTAQIQTITSGITNPDVARNLIVKGAISASTGNVVIKGTDLGGNSITETIALSGTSAVAGLKAFAAVTEIDLPVSAGSGDGVSVGVGSSLGLPYLLTENTVLMAFNNGVKEATAPTVIPDPVNICNNTITLASPLAGNPVSVYIIIPG
ncbi:hypothetical protein DEAC_c23510 [Desulfosporosinus acididurans]|uniref:Uncharacterized protein n=1 Tax=Desulfosporosinus acididurans TaxID=476652 RepID=A0A0J1ILY4_9FIRM|nr:hypothetical protein [Desulfosporosinus acididurans]KLU65721.1 hypothetical protein DEAC_c23510 [Desulfosporosinus acididurans]